MAESLRPLVGVNVSLQTDFLPVSPQNIGIPLDARIPPSMPREAKPIGPFPPFPVDVAKRFDAWVTPDEIKVDGEPALPTLHSAVDTDQTGRRLANHHRLPVKRCLAQEVLRDMR